MNNSSDDKKKTNGAVDQEAQTTQLKYPKSVAFIISNEFCERFNYYGMRTILVLYLNLQLMYSKDDATVIYHTFAMLVYFMCVFGAIISDSWLGKFRTILYLSMVYAAGSVIVSLGAIPPLHLPANVMTLVGLLLVAIGSGGIKPCVAAFGGDQFKLPEQAKQMATFFSLFYFSINLGSLISTTVTPILRKDVHCFGQEGCYSLAFGVPAVLMAVSIVVFILGRPLYISKSAEGNMFALVAKTIGNAIATRWRESKYTSKSHWLDYAESKYDRDLIEDIKVLLRVLVLYIPLPIFWALFDQQGSRWTFQANRMDRFVGNFEVKPEHMQMINPFLILVFIPLYDVAFYPLLAKIGVRRPLQKLTIGGILAGVAFVISGIVQLQMEQQLPALPISDISQLRIFNTVPGCDYVIKSDMPELREFSINSNGYFEELSIQVENGTTFTFQINPADKNNQNCPSIPKGIFQLEDSEAISYFMHAADGNLIMDRYVDYVDRPANGNPEVRVLPSLLQPASIIFKDTEDDEVDEVQFNENDTYRERKELNATEYEISVGGRKVLTTSFLQDKVYTIMISEDKDNKLYSKVVTISAPKSINILWLIPQFFVMTLGEVMFSVTGLEFSYAQAPSSMKSVLQACWQLTVAFGNLIVIIVAETKLFRFQSHEFFLFAGLMFFDMIVFMYLAYRYIPNNRNQPEEEVLPRHSRAKAEALLNE